MLIGLIYYKKILKTIMISHIYYINKKNLKTIMISHIYYINYTIDVK